ncbi:hypothetical protein QL285_078868 [Trifolium repens]|nr:hypothetical protein QL285_078868 [Trifolium repens]
MGYSMEGKHVRVRSLVHDSLTPSSPKIDMSIVAISKSFEINAIDSFKTTKHRSTNLKETHRLRSKYEGLGVVNISSLLKSNDSKYSSASSILGESSVLAHQ